MHGQQRGKSKASRGCTALVRRAALLLIGLLGAVCLLGTLLTRNYSVLGEFSPEDSPGPTFWQQIATRRELRQKILQHHSRKTEGAVGEIPEQQGPITHASEATVAAALRSWKSGSPQQAAADPACAAFWNRNLSSVAVVGNGPISPRQRESIGTHDMVVRFNFLNNMWRDSEQIDVWAVRYSFDAAHRFWGFGQMTTEQASEILQKTQSVWLIGGAETTWAADELIQDLPEVAEHRPVYITQDAFFRGEGSKAAAGMSEFTDAPSTGFIGLSMVLACTRPPTKLHVYGMNWTQKMWSGHNVDMEAMFIHNLERQDRIKVHLAPCANMRTCESAELDSDCHYDLQRRFVCPKPSPQLAGDGLQGPLPLEQREFASVADVLLEAADGTQDAYLGNLAGNVRPFRLADVAPYLKQKAAERQGPGRSSRKGPRLQATNEAFAAE